MQTDRSNTSLPTILAVCTLFALGCDPDLDEAELAQELQDEADEADAEHPGRPETVDEITSAVHPSLANLHAPLGVHETTACFMTSGWAKDLDSTVALQIDLYKGAPYPSGTFVASRTAGQYRSDLPYADKNHGFSFLTPAAFKTGSPETMYIHAVNVDSSGNPVPGAAYPLLDETGHTLCCAGVGTC